MGATVQCIDGYLDRHPEAVDSEEGIRGFWLGPELGDLCPADLAKALASLLAAGRVERRVLPDGRAIYAKGRG